MHRYTEEQIAGHLRPVAQHGYFPRRVEGFHQAVFHEPDAALGEGRENRL
jgi:hypothetical protein